MYRWRRNVKLLEDLRDHLRIMNRGANVPMPVTLIVIEWSLLAGTSARAQDYGPQVSEMVATLSKSMATAGKKSVAVLDLTDLRGRPVCLGQLLAEEVSVGLVSSGQNFEIVSRNDARLTAVIREQKLGASGVIEPQTAAKVGQVVGVQALVMGTVSAIGDGVRVTLALVDSATARIIGGSATTIPRTRAIEEYLADCSGNPAPKPPDDVRSAPGVQRVDAGGLTFDLQACRGGSSITCEIFVLATDDVDLQLTDTVAPFFGRAFDADGNELKLQRLMVGNRESRGRLVANVRTRLAATFAHQNRGASTQSVTLLSLAELALWAQGGFIVQFRNVPVTP